MNISSWMFGTMCWAGDRKTLLISSRMQDTKLVLSCVSNNYFDMAYYKDFSEPGYYWGSFVDVDKPFYFIPYDYFKNSKEDRMGNPIRSSHICRQTATD